MTVGPNFGTWPIGEVQAALTANGGNGSYSWSVVSGSLPTGLALRTDVPSFFPAGASAGIIGVATTPGVYNFTLQVTSNGIPVSSACTMTITSTTMKDLYNLPDAFTGNSYSYTFTPLNAAGPVTFTPPANGVPPGMTFSTAGVLNGTPTAPGAYNMNFSFNDGVSTVYRSAVLNVFAVKITTPAVLPNATRGSAYSTTLTASGGTGPYTFFASGLPGGLSLNSSTGVISGTSNSGQGAVRVQVTVTDANSASYTRFVMLDVLNPPVGAPYFQTYGNLDDCTIGFGCSRAFQVLNGGAAPFTYSVTGLPNGMDFRTSAGDGTQYVYGGDLELWGTPTQLGTFNVRLTATDANGLATSQTFPLRVVELGVWGGDFLPAGTRGVPYSKTLRVLGGTGPYVVSLVSQAFPQFPTGLGLSGFVVSGTPLENGYFNAPFLFSDSAGHTLNQWNYFNINPLSPVLINNGPALGTYVLNANLGIQLSVCCAPGFTWSTTGGSLPPGVTLSAGGLLSGSPTVSGTYSFTAQATDSTNPANFGVRVFNLVVTPISVTSSFTLPFGNVGSAYSTTPTITGASGPVTRTLANMPGNYMPPGLILDTITGTIHGTPSETGQFRFTILFTDTGGNTLLRTFTIFVFAPGGAPAVSILTPANLGTTAIGPFEREMQSTGGNGIFTWTLTSGTLPPGLSLRTDFPSDFSSAATGDLAGVATTPGPYTFTLRATSGPNFAERTFTVKVTALTIKDATTLPDAETGVPYSYTFTALHNAGPVTWSATGVPAGMTFSSAGVLSGTPTTAGVANIRITVNDGVDSYTSWWTWNLNIYTIRFTTPVQLPNATQYLPYSSTVAATGGTPPYSYFASLPAGLTLDPGTGIISGTTTAGAGRYGFNLTVIDAANVSRTRAASITVIGAPKRLMWIYPYDYSDAVVGSPFSLGFSIINGGTPPFSVTASGLPDGMSVRTGAGVTSPYITPADVELYGASNVAGTYNVTLTVTDADGKTVSQTFPVKVGNLHVRGSDFLPNGTRGVPYSKTLRVLGGAPPYTVSLVQGSLPSGLSLSGMVVSGTPLEGGSFNPIFRFKDSGPETLQQREFLFVSEGSSTITVSNTFNGNTFYINQSTGTASVGVAYSNQLFACCAPSYTWSLVNGSLPPGITLSSGGLLGGTPTTAGTYLFTVSAADPTNPSNNGVRLIRLIVTPLVLVNSVSLPFGNVGTPYSQTLSVTGATGSVTWSVDFGYWLPPGLSLSSAGVLSGTPSAAGRHFFNLTATDAAGRVLTRQFNLEIFAAGENPPLALNFGPTIGPNSIGVITYQLTASGGTPPYHFSYAPGAPVIPGMRVLDGPPLPTTFPTTVTGSFAGVILDPGFYTTTLRVTDAVGTTFDRPINWNVVTTVPLSQNSPPKATVGSAYSFTFGRFGGSGNLSFTATNPPSGLSLTSGGVLSGTPTAAGVFNTTITVTDLTTNISIGFTYTIVVNAFAITTGGVLPQGQIGSLYSQTLTAPGCGAGCTWVLASGGLPSGMILSSAGVLSGTPTGFFNNGFLIQASGANGTVQKQFSLLIRFNTIQPLFISSGTTIGPINLGTLANTALFAQGGTPPYTWSLESGSLPKGILLSGPGETLGANLLPGFTYLAGRAMETGTFSFTLRVTDGTGAFTSQAFTYIVPKIMLSYVSLPTPTIPLVYNSPYSQPLLALGGSGVYNSWVATSPMPPGLTLNSTTGVISGTPTNTGSYTVPLVVTDTAGNSIPVNLSFFIASPTGVNIFPNNSNASIIAIGNTTVLGWPIGGGTGPYTLTALTPLPAGCAFESGETILSNNTNAYALVCTPLAPGNFTFTFKVTDALGNIAVRTMTLAVAPFTLFSSTSLPNASVGTAYSQAILAWDNVSTVSWTVAPGSALPPGLNMTGNILAGTPTAAGAYSFVMNATDGSGVVISSTFSLTVSTIHITTADIIPTHAIFGVPYSYTLTATGGGATKTWTATGLPSGLSLSTSGVISGTVVGTGTFRPNITVTDGASTYTRALTLFARYSDPALPGISPPLLALTDARAGASVSYALQPTGGLPPFIFSVAPGSSLPPGLALYSGSSLSAYSSTQTAGATYLQGIAGTPGLYTFDLIATDAAGTQMRRTFTLRVGSMALLAGGIRNMVSGVAYSQQLTVVGGTPPYTFTYSPLGINTDLFPVGLTGSSSGLISGTPASVGNFGFLAKVQDAAGQVFTGSYSYASFNPQGLNIFTPIPFGLSAGIGFSATLTTNQVSTYTWSISSGTLPPGLSLATSAGVTTMSGAPTTPGIYTFTLRAVDPANPSNIAERIFTVPVSPMQYVGGVNTNNPYLPIARVGTPYSYTFKIVGGTPPYTFTPSSLYPMPAGLTLSSSGVLSGTPQQSGQFSFYFVLSDASGASGKVFSGNLNILGVGQNNPLQSLSGTAKSGTLGSPFALHLDQALFGGTAPYSWVVAPGSSLPPGLKILASANGVGAYLGGIPTATGSYTFTLQATDLSGRVAYVPATMTVSPILVSPEVLPNGAVGTPYSVNLAASGGTGPYTFRPLTGSDLPPGVTLSSSGVLSGVPTMPGYFKIELTAEDAAGNSSALVKAMVVEKSGTVQGIGINPADPVAITYTIGGPAPGPIPITTSATSGTLPYTAFASGIPGLSLSGTGGTATGSLNLNYDPASAVAGTYAGVLAVSSPASANLVTAVPVVLTVINPQPCTYTLIPTGSSAAAAGGGNSLAVATGTLCSWSATASDPSWITITSGAGTGPGNVGYTLAANPGVNQRSGSITVGGQTYSITQFGSSCAYAINPATIPATAAGGTAIVNVTATNAACTWTASGLNATPASGSGDQQVTLTILSNPNPAGRVLNATIAGQPFTVNQSGINCTVSLSSSSASIASAGGSGTVDVSTPAGCTYNATGGPGWIAVTSNASGAGPGPVTLAYNVGPNSTTVPRSATLTIGDQSFQISQAATPCSVTVDASALSSPFASIGGAVSIGVTANGANCSWTASSGATWATVSPLSGTGNGTINVTANSNAASATSRFTNLTVAGQSVGVSQSGTACSYSLASFAASVPFAGGAGSVTVTSPSVCSWSATPDPAAPWLTITSSGAAGTSDVVFSAQPNPNASPRSGTLTIAGSSFTVTQGAAPCNYTLSSTGTTLAAPGASSSFTFSTTAAGCSASAVSYSGWLSATTAAAPDGKSGTVNFSAAANPAGTSRVGTIQFAGQTFTVTQSSAACAFGLNAYGVLMSKLGGSAAVLGSPNAIGCVPSVGTDQPSIVTLGALTGPVSNIFTLPYSVSVFNAATSVTRTMTIGFGGQVFRIKQTSW